MKKIYALLIIALFAFAGCFDDEGSEDSTALKVTVNYTGTTPAYGDTHATNVGTAKNYVYLYEELGVRSDTNPTVYSASLNSNNSTVTIDVDPGEYFVAVCYDYRLANQEPKLSQENPYILHISSTGGTTPYIADAEKITISEGNTKTISITFDETWRMGAGQANGRMFIPKP